MLNLTESLLKASERRSKMNKYIHKYNIKPGDRIKVQMGQQPFFTHHAIYLGQDYYGNDLISENRKFQGVHLCYADDFFERYSAIVHIQRFVGNEIARRKAIKRALDYLGKPYSLINFNCEHYANLVQTGKSQSLQVSNAAAGVAVFALLVWLFKD
jgi:hypothetical protein